MNSIASKSVHVGPLREMSANPAALHLTEPQSLLVFTTRNCGDLSSQYWYPGVELGPHAPPGVLPQLDIPPDSQLPHAGVGPVHSVSPPLLEVLKWPLLCVPRCKTSVRLDFRRLPMMAVL